MWKDHRIIINQKIKILRVASFLIIIIGIFLRVWQFAANRSLWFDEALLVLNIVNRCFSGLTKPLDYNQGAPIGFLWIEKGIIQLMGNHDFILRFFPLFAGIIAVILMWSVADNFIGGFSALIVLGLFAVNGQIIYFASEVKQYSSDVMLSLLLLFFAYKYLESNAKSKVYFVLLGALGIVGIWISHPLLFILIGIGIAFSIDFFIRKDWKNLFSFGLIVMFWVISFSLDFLFSLRFLSSNADLANYWNSYFMPIPPWTDGNWFIEIWKRFLVDPVGLPSILITTAVLLIGVYSALVKKWQYALVFLIPFPVILLASGIRKYPFGGRLLLFIIPIIFLLIGVGIKQILVWLQKINSWIGPVCTAILVLFFMYQPALNALQNVQTPIMREHIKPILATLSENKQDMDYIYVYYGAEPALRYYAPQFGLSRSNYIVGVVSRTKPNLYKQDIDKLRGNKRVWFVFSHNCNFFPCKVDEEEFILQYLDMIGAKLLEIKQPGSSLYLYDLSLKNPNG